MPGWAWTTGVTPGRLASTGSVVHGTVTGIAVVGVWLRTGKPAAWTADGFVEVWSTIRLLTVRGCESKTLPFFWAYEEDVGAGGAGGGPKKPAGAPSAGLNFGLLSRGNCWSAAANVSRSGKRLLHEPSTVRRP